jgi:hypothetical protein
MISLLKQLEWNYIVVIYDMDIYGTEGYYIVDELTALFCPMGTANADVIHIFSSFERTLRA